MLVLIRLWRPELDGRESVELPVIVVVHIVLNQLVSLAIANLELEWYQVGRFLGPNISGHYRRYPVAWTADAWRRAGLRDVGVRVMSLGGGLVMWGTRAGD